MYHRVSVLLRFPLDTSGHTSYLFLQNQNAALNACACFEINQAQGRDGGMKLQLTLI